MTNPSLAHRGRWLVAFAVALTAAALLAPVASAQGPASGTPATSVPAGTPGALVVGAGTTTLGERFPEEFRGDRIVVALNAIALPGQATRGTFTITHREPDGALFADLRGHVNCLSIEGDHAVVTGVITTANTPGLPGGEVHEGMLAAIVVRDGGDNDRMAWTFGDPEMVPDGAELPAVAVAPVEQGNFVVRP
ncbi:MAG: hypothetical protein AB7R89_30270 [Dehalococcoidia bacterium]